MRQQRLRDMQRQPAQKDTEEKDPFKVLKQSAEERAFTNPVTHDSERDVTETIEDNDDTKPHLPAVNVVFVEVAIEPADSEIVGECHDPGCADGVVCTDIGDDGDFGGEADVAEEKTSEEFCEGTLVDPFADGVEKEFVAAVGVFLPTR